MQKSCSLIAVVLLLAACSSGKVVVVVPTPVVSSSSATSPQPSPSQSDNAIVDAAFLSVAREVVPGSPDADIIALGHSICSGFDRGATWVQELKVMLDDGTAAYGAGKLLGAATAAYCPQYESLAP